MSEENRGLLRHAIATAQWDTPNSFCFQREFCFCNAVDNYYVFHLKRLLGPFLTLDCFHLLHF